MQRVRQNNADSDNRTVLLFPRAADGIAPWDESTLTGLKATLVDYTGASSSSTADIAKITTGVYKVVLTQAEVGSSGVYAAVLPAIPASRAFSHELFEIVDYDGAELVDQDHLESSGLTPESIADAVNPPRTQPSNA